MAETTGIGESAMACATALFIEGPEVFERAAAARDDGELRPAGTAEKCEAAADVFDRAGALHARGKKPNVQAGETA